MDVAVVPAGSYRPRRYRATRPGPTTTQPRSIKIARALPPADTRDRVDYVRKTLLRRVFLFHFQNGPVKNRTYTRVDVLRIVVIRTRSNVS